jgi:hypothetical protein
MTEQLTLTTQRTKSNYNEASCTKKMKNSRCCSRYSY